MNPISCVKLSPYSTFYPEYIIGTRGLRVRAIYNFDGIKSSQKKYNIPGHGILHSKHTMATWNGKDSSIVDHLA